jgi:hypothetical protein
VTAHGKCPTCHADVEIEIRVAASNGADGPHVDMLGTEVLEMDCPHRGEMLMWLDTDAGYRWALAEVDAWRLTA